MRKCKTLVRLGAVALSALVFLGSLDTAFAAPLRCVNVYFDRSEDGDYWMGRTYANMLQNLLGHFPEFQQVVGPIELYRSGDIEKCAVTFYIGSYFGNGVPKAFYEDFEKTSKRVAWIGYNVWNFSPASLRSMFGHEYVGLTELDLKNRTASGEPTFFKDILYKGEIFHKYGKFSKEDPKLFVAPFEMTILRPAGSSAEMGGVQVLAEARHTGTGEKLPYIVRKANRFYVGDVPFSFLHEADRYLVFADVLFDILGAEPRHNGRYAFLRIEDIHPLVPLSYLYSITNALKTENVPVNISLIPIFFDPLHQFTRARSQEFVTITQVPEFMQFLREVQAEGGVMIWHGSTHQLGRVRNPHTGVSGDDFEFWDAVRGQPLAQDSAEFVLDRLDAGFYDLKKAGIYPKIWLTPHYQASPLDYMIFARVFPWNVGRAVYFNHHLANRPPPLPPAALWFSERNAGEEARKIRLAHFRQYQVAIESDRWSGQMYPYEIYGDIYGQRLLPENLGNSQPTENAHVVQPRSVQEMVRDAKRNLVLRDAWASFFYHAQLLNTAADGGRGRYPGDPSELAFLVRELKKLGYRFIRIDEFTEKNKTYMRPEPIDLEREISR